MPDTRTTQRIQAALISVENAELSISTIEYQPEFKLSAASRSTIAALQAALEYSGKQLKILYQRAVAHTLKKE